MASQVVVKRAAAGADVLQRDPNAGHKALRHGVEVDHVAVGALLCAATEVERLEGDRATPVERPQGAFDGLVGGELADLGEVPPRVLDPVRTRSVAFVEGVIDLLGDAVELGGAQIDHRVSVAGVGAHQLTGLRIEIGIGDLPLEERRLKPGTVELPGRFHCVRRLVDSRHPVGGEALISPGARRTWSAPGVAERAFAATFQAALRAPVPLSGWLPGARYGSRTCRSGAAPRSSCRR